MILKPLLAYLTITATLTIVLLISRAGMVLLNKKKSNEFPSWEKHGEGLYWRLHRSHINSLENLSFFGALCLIGYVLNIEDPNYLNLGWLVIGGRVFQILSHLSGDGIWNVNFRFSGYIVQVVSFLGMIYIAYNQFS
jgi:hypothetical protein